MSVPTLVPEPPFLVVAAGFVLDFHERGDRCQRCRAEGICPRVAHARRLIELYRQAKQIARGL